MFDLRRHGHRAKPNNSVPLSISTDLRYPRQHDNHVDYATANDLLRVEAWLIDLAGLVDDVLKGLGN